LSAGSDIRRFSAHEEGAKCDLGRLRERRRRWTARASRAVLAGSSLLRACGAAVLAVRRAAPRRDSPLHPHRRLYGVPGRGDPPYPSGCSGVSVRGEEHALRGAAGPGRRAKMRVLSNAAPVRRAAACALWSSSDGHGVAAVWRAARGAAARLTAVERPLPVALARVVGLGVQVTGRAGGRADARRLVAVPSLPSSSLGRRS